MNYIDTHFHLDLWKKPKELAEEIEMSKIYTIAVTNTPSVFNFTYNLLKDKKYLRAALGLHPELVYQRANELPLFMESITKTKYIGEIGLDFSKRNISNKDEQIKIFEKIIDKCSAHGKKIITIHSRKAEKEVVEIIGNRFPGKVILHWYSGSIQTLELALDYGFYFSINYQMTISKHGQNIIKKIPVNRILIESDGPFIDVSGVENNPLIIERTYNQVQKKLNIPNIVNIVFNNFARILKA